MTARRAALAGVSFTGRGRTIVHANRFVLAALGNNVVQNGAHRLGG